MTSTPLAFFALREPTAWLDRRGASAVCAQVDAELWFPEKGDRTTSQTAKRLCGTCPLEDACRTWALDNPEASRFGVWGGLTERERREERRRRRRLGEPAGLAHPMREVA